VHKPSLVYDVTATSPSVLLHNGGRFRLQRMPAGSQVIYGPEAREPIVHITQAIAGALDKPLDAEPLASRLRADMKLTIAFDDGLIWLMPSHEPDGRRLAIEQVLEMAAVAGVDDVELIVARGLNRRLTNSELERVLGERVYDAFGQQGWIKQHDAEDPEQLVDITNGNGQIQINKRAVESDLLIYVSSMATSAQQIVASLAGRDTALRLQQSDSTEIIDSALNTLQLFHVGTISDERSCARSMPFVEFREPNWRLRDRLAANVLCSITQTVPRSVAQAFWKTLRTDRRLVAVEAGSVQSTVAALQSRNDEVSDHSSNLTVDVLSVDVPQSIPFATPTHANPIVALHYALSRALSGRPVLKPGGVLVLHYPLAAEFDSARQLCYFDFYNRVLGKLSGTEAVSEDIVKTFAGDHWYTQLYRNSYAYHGVHPLVLWRQCQQYMKQVEAVLVIGGNATVAERLGLRSLANLQDALEVARDLLSMNELNFAHLHTPTSSVAKS
jgi:lactate racemase